MKAIGIKIFGVISIVSIILFFLFFLFLLFEGHVIRKDIELNGKITIGKYISHRRFKKGQVNYLSFNIGGVRYKGEGGHPPVAFSKNIGKFYKIRYSEKFKGSIKAFFDEEVTDTTEIMKAGFTKKEIYVLGNDSLYAREASFKEEVLAIFDSKQ